MHLDGAFVTGKPARSAAMLALRLFNGPKMGYRGKTLPDDG